MWPTASSSPRHVAARVARSPTKLRLSSNNNSHRVQRQNHHAGRHHPGGGRVLWVVFPVGIVLWYVYSSRRRQQVVFKPMKPSAVLVPLCKACNLPIDLARDDHVVQFGANLHSSCVKCFVCSQTQTANASGLWSFWQQRVWTKNSPDTSIYFCCGALENKNWHKRMLCFRHYLQKCSPKCSVCNKKVIGRSDVVIYPSGEAFCKHHSPSIDKSRLCYNCSRSELFEGCQPFLDPKQLSCRKCREDEGLVSSDSTLLACSGVVLRAFSNLGLDFEDFEIRIELRPQEWFEVMVPPKMNYPHYEGITIKKEEAFGYVRKCHVVVRNRLKI